MDSLVANYDSSSEDEKSNSECGSQQNTLNDDKSENQVNFLTGENVEDSDDDLEETLEKNEEYKNACRYLNMRQNSSKLPNPIADPLPSPMLGQKLPSTITKQVDSSSVFSNQFRNAEDEKLSVLEKHVKTTTLEKKNEIGGKKICWNYRKGKCKKGHRCQFAHDNDIPRDITGITAMSNSVGQQSSNDISIGYLEPELPDDDSYMANKKRKKKYGVKDCLVPPKKAYSDLQKQRAEQRPWTVNNQ